MKQEREKTYENFTFTALAKEEREKVAKQEIVRTERSRFAF